MPLAYQIAYGLVLGLGIPFVCWVTVQVYESIDNAILNLAAQRRKEFRNG